MHRIRRDAQFSPESTRISKFFSYPGYYERVPMRTWRYLRNDLLGIIWSRYSRIILLYLNKLHLRKIIHFITTFFSSNLITNFFDCTVQVKYAIHPLWSTRFWNNLHQVRSQSRNVGKPNNLNVLESKKTKRPTNDSKNRLRPYMPEGRESYF